jgi:recombinational DNA repair protein RecR
VLPKHWFSVQSFVDHCLSCCLFSYFDHCAVCPSTLRCHPSFLKRSNDSSVLVIVYYW